MPDFIPFADAVPVNSTTVAKFPVGTSHCWMKPVGGYLKCLRIHTVAATRIALENMDPVLSSARWLIRDVSIAGRLS